MADDDRRYASRGGLKLAAALEAFDLDPAGLTCADLGASTGGFTDCLLRAGAARVYAVDTAYGALDYRLRTDERVVVMERTNALHAEPPAGGVDLVVADMGWTAQRLLVPAALRWLKPDVSARIVTLIKPHYEIKGTAHEAELVSGVLPEEVAERVAQETADRMPEHGARALGLIRSPIRGGGSRGGGRKRRKGGNLEWLALLEPSG